MQYVIVEYMFDTFGRFVLEEDIVFVPNLYMRNEHKAKLGVKKKQTVNEID